MYKFLGLYWRHNILHAFCLFLEAKKLNSYLFIFLLRGRLMQIERVRKVLVQKERVLKMELSRMKIFTISFYFFFEILRIDG